MQCLIVEDHPLTRDGTAIALRDVDAAIEVFEAESLAQAQKVLREHPRIDLVLLDLDLGDSLGVETLQVFKKWADEHEVYARVVVLSGHCELKLVCQVILDLATGFILKATPRELFHPAIVLTLAGGVYVPEEIRKQLATQRGPANLSGSDPRPLGLTPRQTDVAALLIQGFTYKRIAKELEKRDGKSVSEHTVRVHLTNIAHKLGVTENAKASVMAEIARRGLVFPMPDRAR